MNKRSFTLPHWIHTVFSAAVLTAVLFIHPCIVSPYQADAADTISLSASSASSSGKTDSVMPQSPSLAKTRAVTADRPFRGAVRWEMANAAATLAAELNAYEIAARELAKSPELQFINNSGQSYSASQDSAGPMEGTLPSPILPDGLARLVYRTQTLVKRTIGFPPSLHAEVVLGLVPPQNLRNSIVTAVSRKDAMELYAQLMLSQKKLLARYDKLAADLITRNTLLEGGREEQHLLQATLNEIRALDLYGQTIPLYGKNLAAPQQVREKLEQALRLSSNNPLILTALAEVLMQMDRPAEALDAVSRALQSAPEFARAHDVKGAALLRQHLPALAAESFGTAIKLAPSNPVYYMHRGSAYLIQEETAAMCNDFTQACSLGDCEGMQWAKGTGICPTNSAPSANVPPLAVPRTDTPSSTLDPESPEGQEASSDSTGRSSSPEGTSASTIDANAPAGTVAPTPADGAALPSAAVSASSSSNGHEKTGAAEKRQSQVQTGTN